MEKKEKQKWFLKGGLSVILLTVVLQLIEPDILHFFGKTDTVTARTETKLKLLRKYIDQEYLWADQIDEEQMQDYILKGYMAGTQDKYAAYYDKEETKEMYESSRGEYCGIGVQVSQEQAGGSIVFHEVYKDSPAAEAGFQNGDILSKINGKSVSGMKIDEVTGKMRGEQGTQVTLTVVRGDEAKEYEAVVVRRKIEAQTVEYEMKDGGVGYVWVKQFDTVTYEQFLTAVGELQNKGMKGLLIDLRGNPGGNLDTVCQMLDVILPGGTIVYTEDRNGKRETFTSDEERKMDLPMVVLVNEKSASASEIFAGALQDYGKAAIVGMTTFGKGIVQDIFPLPDGTAVKMTVSEYFTPKGRSIHGKGVKPDVEVEYIYDPRNPDADNQLDRAAEVLKDLTAKQR